MTSAIDTARELLARTRNISACLDSIVQPHLRVLELRNELSSEPFIELERTRIALSSELGSIEGLLGKGLVNEAWSAITAYESRTELMLPSLRRLSGQVRGMRVMGTLSPELDRIEGMVLGHDLAGADTALSALESAGMAAPAKAEPDVTPSIGNRTATCALCGRTVRADLDLCPYCGWELNAPASECPECGSRVLLAFRSCPSCGKGLPERSKGSRMVLSSLEMS